MWRGCRRQLGACPGTSRATPGANVKQYCIDQHQIPRLTAEGGQCSLHDAACCSACWLWEEVRGRRRCRRRPAGTSNRWECSASSQDQSGLISFSDASLELVTQLGWVGSPLPPHWLPQEPLVACCLSAVASPLEGWAGKRALAAPVSPVLSPCMPNTPVHQRVMPAL